MFDQAKGNPITAWALPEAKLSMTLPSSSTDGCGSNSFMLGKHSMDFVPAGDTVSLWNRGPNSSPGISPSAGRCLCPL